MRSRSRHFVISALLPSSLNLPDSPSQTEDGRGDARAEAHVSRTEAASSGLSPAIVDTLPIAVCC